MVIQINNTVINNNTTVNSVLCVLTTVNLVLPTPLYGDFTVDCDFQKLLKKKFQNNQGGEGGGSGGRWVWLGWGREMGKKGRQL